MAGSPKRRVEGRNEATSLGARQITDKQAADRLAKTERLRAAKLAQTIGRPSDGCRKDNKN
jgi:hypothetical protein